MKYGIYYAYWEKEWGGDFLPYIPLVKKLGFVHCGTIYVEEDDYPRLAFEKVRV